MSLYVIGDTHFSSVRNKPMDVFGGKWLNYDKKLIDSIGECMTENDTLVICGDFSWGMSLDDTISDFKLLDSFPGKKYLLKGNHDYWWDTVSKMKNFFKNNNITSIDFLHNNFFTYNEKIVLCGTRGWMYDIRDPSSKDDKIFKREVQRLRQSLETSKNNAFDKEIVCFLHYPPIFRDYEINEFTDILMEYGVKRCYYGHLHADSIKYAFTGEKKGIQYFLVSADSVDFKPVLISE